MCCTRLGEVAAAKEAVRLTSRLGGLGGLSALCQVLRNITEFCF